MRYLYRVVDREGFIAEEYTSMAPVRYVSRSHALMAAHRLAQILPTGCPYTVERRLKNAVDLAWEEVKP